MRLLRSAPVLIIGTAVLVLAALTLSANRLVAGLLNGVEAGQFELMRAIVEFNLRGGQERAQSGAELLAEMPEVKAAFAQRDRAALLAITAPAFQIQQARYGLHQMQFVTPDNVSFLRLQEPAVYGDDLSTFRASVVTANREKTVQEGIALSRTGAALVGVVPVTDDTKKHIGILEFGLDFGPILDKIKAAYGFDCTFFVREEPLRRVATDLDPTLLDEHNRVGAFLKYHSTNWGLMEGLIASQDLAKVNGEAVHYVRNSSIGGSYGVVLVTLRNSAGTAIGILAAARDFSDTRTSRGRTAINLITLALLGVIVLAGAVFIAIRGYVLRPVVALSEGISALARGDASVEVDAAGFCTELETAAAAYEQLRQSMSKDQSA